jgi:putative aminopeptidase
VAVDVGFPCRYTHSSLEMCDLSDLEGLTRLLVAALGGSGRGST